MDETNKLLHPFIFPLLISLLLLWLVKWLSGNKNLPPSPRKLPILGNLHQLGFLPHRNLQSLAVKHGPFMLLHFGSVPVLIASTADAAREALKTHDLSFASRPQLFRAVKKFIRDGRNVGFAPYGEYWRQMRGISVIHLLSSKRVQSFRFIREEETAAFVKRIRESSGLVNFSSMVSEFTNDVICRSAFGRKYSDSENGKKVLALLSESMELLGTVCIGDFIPWLSWVSRVNGFDKRLDKAAKELDEFLEGVIVEHAETTKRQQGQNGESFVDVLLHIHNHNAAQVSIDTESIKSLLVDILGAGTDTLTTLLIWAMAELLRHPIVMEQLQNEVREVVKDKQDISDKDLEKMHYLKAVIKETFRCHPPVPLLIPRIASSDVKIKGYDIPAGTMLITNAWAIGKDPASWDEPEKFEPGRFLNSSIDYKGLDFELIPFGAGRRGCPGIAFSAATVEFVLANLVWKFNWELPDGRKDVDMTETAAATLHKAVPLLALAYEYA